MAHPGIGRDHDRPECSHYDNEEHGSLSLPEPQERERDPAHAGQGLQTQSERPDGIVKNFPTRR